MVSKACVVGAYQTKLEELARLPEMELTVVVPPYWRDRGQVLRLERQHTSGYELVVERAVLNGSYHFHFYPGLGRQIRRTRPEIVHIDEEPYNLATAHALMMARQVGARTVFFSWQNLLRRYPWPVRALESRVLRYVDYGIAGNQQAVRVWRAKGYGGPLAVIPQFGVDPDIFSPASPGTRGAAPFTIGYVGRLVEEKGVDLLLAAVRDLDGPWQLEIVGAGPARASLQALAGRLELAGQVSFAGQVPSAAMPDHYRRLDALVLPSRTRPNWKEQFGRALVEAMACGVPVVGSDSGEIPYVIGDAGLIFAEGRAEALRDCLERIRSQPELREELSRRGRRRVLEHYTQAQIAARTYEVYRALV